MPDLVPAALLAAGAAYLQAAGRRTWLLLAALLAAGDNTVPSRVDLQILCPWEENGGGGVEVGGEAGSLEVGKMIMDSENDAVCLYI